MDTTDPDIVFDENGICNHYHEYNKAAKQILLPENTREEFLQKTIEKIKRAGANNKYNCLIGLSGGVDSSYVAWLVYKYGLRPLTVHFDNGWNSELAVQNIHNIVTKLNFDLHTLVVNWEEFKDIQLSYLKAGVVDIEVVTDHAIQATMYKLARDYKIGFVISGTNFVTEFIMPPGWIYTKLDLHNLKDIHRKYGNIKLKTYPHIGFYKQTYYNLFYKLIPFSILDYVDYNKAKTKELLKSELDWKDYGGKHYESVFTKFYQAYILPEKFNIDKRKAHLSTLICSRQITRDEALQEMQKPLYNEKELMDDIEYVIKKFEISKKKLDNILNDTPRNHSEFKSDKNLRQMYMKLMRKTSGLRTSLKR